MDLSEIEIGKKYVCDYAGLRFFALVLEKLGALVCVRLLDQLDEHGDPGGPVDRTGTIGEIWVSPKTIHEM